MADRTQQWLIQKGGETKIIYVSSSQAKDKRTEIGKEGWSIRSSTFADSPNYQKAFEKQITKTEFGESGLQQEKEIHEEQRREQQKISTVDVDVGDKVVRMPLSPEFQQKLEEGQSKIEHDIRREQQIEKEVVTPKEPRDQYLLVEPASSPTGQPSTISLSGKVVPVGYTIPEAKTQLERYKPEVIPQISTTTVKTTTGITAGFGKGISQPIPPMTTTSLPYKEFKGLEQGTIGITTIGKDIRVAEWLPKPIKNFVTEHEMLHNIYPSDTESQIVMRQLKREVKTVPSIDTNDIFIAPRKSDVSGVIKGVPVSEGVWDAYDKALGIKKPMKITGMMSFPDSEDLITTSGGKKTTTSTSTVTTSTGKIKNPLIEEYVSEIQKGTAKGEIVPSIVSGFATRITPEDPLGLKSIWTFGEGVVTGKKMGEIKTDLDKITEDSLRWWGKQTLTPENELKKPLPYFADTISKTSTGKLAIVIGGSYLLKAGAGILSSLSPTAGFVFETGVGAVSTAKLGYELPTFGASIYSGIKEGEYADVFSKLGETSFLVAGGVAGYKEAEKLFEPLPETIIPEPPEGNRWGVKTESIETKKLKTGKSWGGNVNKDIDVFSERIEAELIPVKIKPPNAKDVVSGKFIKTFDESGLIAGKFEQKVKTTPGKIEIEIKDLKDVGVGYNINRLPETSITSLQKKTNLMSYDLSKEGSIGSIIETKIFNTGGGGKSQFDITSNVVKTATRSQSILPSLKDIIHSLGKGEQTIKGIPGTFASTIYIGDKETEKMIADQNKAEEKRMLTGTKIKPQEIQLPPITGYGKEELKVTGVPGVFKKEKSVMTGLASLIKDEKLEEELKKQGKNLYSKTGLKSYEEAIKVPKTKIGVVKVSEKTKKPKQIKYIQPKITMSYQDQKLKYKSPYSSTKKILEEEYYIKPPGSPAISVPNVSMISQIPSPSQVSVPEIMSLQPIATVPSQKDKTSSKTLQLTGVSEIIKQMTSPTTEMKKSTEEITKPSSASATRLKIDSTTILGQSPISRSIQKTFQTPIFDFKFNYQTPNYQTQQQPPPPPPPIIIPDLDIEPMKYKPLEGFDVEIRKMGKWVRVTGEPLLKSEALKYGGYIVGKTPRASFRLTPSTRKPQRTRLPYIFEPQKFRRPKKGSRLNEGVFIEKSKYRIDMPGELKGITFKGLETLKTKPRKIKKPRKTKRKSKTKTKSKRKKSTRLFRL